MKTETLPLKKQSIADIYNNDKATFEVPIYQRNYAWGKDEIAALIQDVYDAYTAKKQNYYIGTLVSFHKGDQVYEVIDGQQRLTTIYLVLSVLDVSVQNKLTYRARTKSNDTIQSIPDFKIDEKDHGIVNGFEYAEKAIKEIVANEVTMNKEGFKTYFQHSVHLIHYQVPKDIDLNKYFEIMNSRGEQLEKHEIIKARLIENLNDIDKAKFNKLWEFCSEMNVYIQQKYRDEKIFDKFHDKFKISKFDDLPEVDDRVGRNTINELIYNTVLNKEQNIQDNIDTFQPIIDFSNFLLIVLKLTRMEEGDFIPTDFILDDKELIHEFDKVQVDKDFVKKFGFNLLQAKFLLDNFIVHHSNEDDTIENNPWKLQYWYKDSKSEYLKNRDTESDRQHKLVHLLSMFEVSFTARQRKNYLFYCLLYLFRSDDWNIEKYCTFVSDLADKYFKDVYMVEDNLNTINTPNPGSFDNTILPSNGLNVEVDNGQPSFDAIYGDGTTISKGVSLFVFNYLDYKLWEKYSDELRGEKTKEGSKERKDFFVALGCSDLGLKVFDQFYFSRTRRSLEHFFPRAGVDGKSGVPTQEQINCFGNYAMIGSEVNSSGSDWRPITKLSHYLDDSGKIKLVSVASLKFMIMMQKCKDNEKSDRDGEEWNFDDIREHQNNMVEVLLGD